MGVVEEGVGGVGAYWHEAGVVEGGEFGLCGCQVGVGGAGGVLCPVVGCCEDRGVGRGGCDVWEGDGGGCEFGLEEGGLEGMEEGVGGFAEEVGGGKEGE